MWADWVKMSQLGRKMSGVLRGRTAPVCVQREEVRVILRPEAGMAGACGCAAGGGRAPAVSFSSSAIPPRRVSMPIQRSLAYVHRLLNTRGIRGDGSYRAQGPVARLHRSTCPLRLRDDSQQPACPQSQRRRLPPARP